MIRTHWSTTTVTGGVCTVTLRGELDMAQAGDLAAILTDASRHPEVTAVAVDLAAVRFLDSTVISSLIAGYHAAADTGAGYQVTAATGHVADVLRIAGVLDLLAQPLPGR